MHESGVDAINSLALQLSVDEVFYVREFSVTEHISALFSLTVVAVCDAPAVDLEPITGDSARFTITTTNAFMPVRTWLGIVSASEQLAAEETGLSTYHFTIAPRLWLLTQRRNYRMFQQMSDLDIVLSLLEEWGIEHALHLDRGQYLRRKVRVQYAESDYDFIARLLEDSGVSYFFDHTQGTSKLVLSDMPGAAAPRPRPLRCLEQSFASRGEHAWNVRLARRVRPGRYTIADHDYRKPAERRLVATETAATTALEARLERYHYVPGAFLFGTDTGESTPVADDRGMTRTNETEAKKIAGNRLAAKRANASTISFEANVLDLAPGSVVSLTDHPRPELGSDSPLLVTETTLVGTEDEEWSITCECVSASVPFRPPLSTPKPVVYGPESATVVGPAGEAIHTDEFGRVRVHFHWDRDSTMDEESSPWLHVAQAWAGAAFGAIALPRVGQEVLVEFLGGDPDRPIVTGRVYTNLQKVPYALPENATKCGLVSRSLAGDGGYNEVMFEDAAGKELVRVRAARDYERFVGASEETSIGADQKIRIGNDRTLAIDGSDTAVAGSSVSLVRENRREVTGMNKVVTVAGNRSTEVGGDEVVRVAGAYTLSIAAPAGGAPTVSTLDAGQVRFDNGAGSAIELDGSTVRLRASRVEIVADELLSPEAEKPETRSNE